jgi:hypothetical protein
MKRRQTCWALITLVPREHLRDPLLATPGQTDDGATNSESPEQRPRSDRYYQWREPTAYR